MLFQLRFATVAMDHRSISRATATYHPAHAATRTHQLIPIHKFPLTVVPWASTAMIERPFGLGSRADIQCLSGRSGGSLSLTSGMRSPSRDGEGLLNLCMPHEHRSTCTKKHTVKRIQISTIDVPCSIRDIRLPIVSRKDSHGPQRTILTIVVGVNSPILGNTNYAVLELQLRMFPKVAGRDAAPGKNLVTLEGRERFSHA
ncbi:hypothetical protein F5I97DRAFT_460644 [Phlebopus sp. FC_14]|nr:hypothetical protein F5I97DRAFT_460644 [Phlebopus sp. FC_14]